MTNTAPFDLFASAGLLNTKTGTIDITRPKFTGPPTRQTLAVRIYDLTAMGQKALRHPDAQPNAVFGPLGDQFCYGTPQVDAITRFTEPSPVMGTTVSSVRYRYRLKDKADWATLPSMIAAFPILAKTTAADGAEGRTTLVLTSSGWVDTRSNP
ncbi:hypothetical protein D3Y57_17700 [Sphingomonas paeninsulae]|uniref:Uncharacterized protein n=1 Tax=Sphingomonas paeninsulae TaxID=2319844 RepID=A0A494TD70_SPHPE|nr:hypothetical protein [Sphingomonas paeninsulae]AYJ87427.1 hypothetical protein D3Y57_17700 [Sphingomonas paeninsulae]